MEVGWGRGGGISVTDEGAGNGGGFEVVSIQINILF